MARQVSILGPRGYEPRTLPLRHVPILGFSLGDHILERFLTGSVLRGGAFQKHLVVWIMLYIPVRVPRTLLLSLSLSLCRKKIDASTGTHTSHALTPFLRRTPFLPTEPPNQERPRPTEGPPT